MLGRAAVSSCHLVCMLSLKRTTPFFLFLAVAPVVPDLSSDIDTSNFDDLEEDKGNARDHKALSLSSERASRL